MASTGGHAQDAWRVTSMGLASPVPLRQQGDTVAVIDSGSNSGRVVVYTKDIRGPIRLLAATRAGLGLVGETTTEHGLIPEARPDRPQGPRRDRREGCCRPPGPNDDGLVRQTPAAACTADRPSGPDTCVVDI